MPVEFIEVVCRGWEETTAVGARSAPRYGRGPTRTGDPLGVNEVLWPTELRALDGLLGNPKVRDSQHAKLSGMLAALREHRARRIALWIAVPIALAVVLAQVFLPALAAKRIMDRVARYGTVKSVSVSAWPALELLWGKAGSVTVRAGSLTMTSTQIASLLAEAHKVRDMKVNADEARIRVAGLPRGLTLSQVQMEKHGSSIQAVATLTQPQLDEALPNGFHVEPVASGAGQVEVKASGGLFGVQASIDALVKPLEGRLVAEPQGFPLAGFGTVTLFSDPRLEVQSVGVQVQRAQPLTYGLSLRASLR
jgi:hypothetical protein